jgi:peptidoglycan/LPS O-acetylase OafA/YrhL
LSFSLFASSLAITFLLPFVPFFDQVGLTGAFKDHTPILFVPAVAFFVAAILGSPVLSRILSWRLLGFIGMISYSLFLIHGTVILLVGEHLLRRARPILKQLDGAATWIAFVGYFGFTLVVAGMLAYLGYRYIESPFLRHKPD